MEHAFQLPVDKTLHPVTATTLSHPFYLTTTVKSGPQSWSFGAEKRWYWLSARAVLYNTCSKISQQLLLTSFHTVQPNTVMLKQNTFSLHGSSHCDIKAVMEKWAENKTKGGKHTVKSSIIMFNMDGLFHLFQFQYVTQNHFLVKFN